MSGVGYYPDGGGELPSAVGLGRSPLGSSNGGRVLLLDVLVPQASGSEQPRPKKPAKHGPRGSRPKVAVILSFNSSGEPQLRSALRHLQPKKNEEATEHTYVAAMCCRTRFL